MVQRMWAEAAGPTGGAEPLFPGSRRSRSVWDAVRLEVGGPDSCPVVLHSFTQLDPDLPRLEATALVSVVPTGGRHHASFQLAFTSPP
ncbi:hypothetical protein MC885_007263, partial [Smutsia gigantea]